MGEVDNSNDWAMAAGAQAIKMTAIARLQKHLATGRQMKLFKARRNAICPLTDGLHLLQSESNIGMIPSLNFSPFYESFSRMLHLAQALFATTLRLGGGGQ